jgi:hypothetical protein
LLVLNADKRILMDNDDANGNTVDSEIYMSLEPGIYTVIATELYGDIGKYSIVLDIEKARPCPSSSFDAPGTVAGSLTSDGCRTMDLYAPSDSTIPAATFSMKVAERVWTTVSAKGTAMNPFVEIIQSNGTPVGIDGPVEEKAVLLLPGTYTVNVIGRIRG